MQPTAHTVLRDRRHWLGGSSGLKIDPDGDLLLAQVPAPSNGKAVNVSPTYPYVREVSGLAVGPCDAVFVADTAHDRVLFVDGLCKSQAWVDAPGHLRSPRGLALTGDALLIADSANTRVQSLALPRLEANVQWNWWEHPTGIAVDSKQRLLVVDSATSPVNRMLPGDGVDEPFEAAIASQGKLQKPLFVACGSGRPCSGQRCAGKFGFRLWSRRNLRL